MHRFLLNFVVVSWTVWSLSIELYEKGYKSLYVRNGCRPINWSQSCFCL